VGIRYRLLLPIVGLVLFAVVTYDAVRMNREAHPLSTRYFWWSSIRLDSDPQNRHPRQVSPTPCKDGRTNCVEWDPVEIWVDPGVLTLALGLSSFPAFSIAGLIVHGLAKLGVSEVLTFMTAVPILIAAWYYLIGLLLDRWRRNRRQYTAALGAG
jgi:hypothetical protein